MPTNAIRVWGRPNSVNVQKVMWCIGEIGLECERIDAGLEFGVVDETWFLELNPNGLIPLMKHGELSLWESNTIVRYLASRFSLGNLCPPAPAARAAVEKWMDWQLSTLGPAQTRAFWGLVRTPEAERDYAAIERSVRRTNRAFAVLDGHLATHDFVGGPDFTMGDIPLGAMTYRWLSLEGIERPDWPALRRWYARLSDRPAYREHVMLPLT
jgi:glutathione S-transferase